MGIPLRYVKAEKQIGDHVKMDLREIYSEDGTRVRSGSCPMAGFVVLGSL